MFEPFKTNHLRHAETMIGSYQQPYFQSPSFRSPERRQLFEVTTLVNTHQLCTFGQVVVQFHWFQFLSVIGRNKMILSHHRFPKTKHQKYCSYHDQQGRINTFGRPFHHYRHHKQTHCNQQLQHAGPNTFARFKN